MNSAYHVNTINPVNSLFPVHFQKNNIYQNRLYNENFYELVNSNSLFNINSQSIPIAITITEVMCIPDGNKILTMILQINSLLDPSSFISFYNGTTKTCTFVLANGWTGTLQMFNPYILLNLTSQNWVIHSKLYKTN